MDIELSNVEYVTDLQKININQKLKKGVSLGIVGKMGSGKSLILKLLSGDIKPTSGTVKMNRRPIKNSSIGYVASYISFNHHTVAQEIEYILEKNNYPAHKRVEQLNNTIKMIGFSSDYLDRDPFSLSSSEAKLLQLGLAICYNPKVVILDNPTYGLDSQGKLTYIRILTLMKTRYQKSIVIVDSDMDFLYRLCDTFWLMEDGCVVCSGDRKDFFSDDRTHSYMPSILSFEKRVFELKKIKLGYNRVEINDLIKDILRMLY